MKAKLYAVLVKLCIFLQFGFYYGTFGNFLRVLAIWWWFFFKAFFGRFMFLLLFWIIVFGSNLGHATKIVFIQVWVEIYRDESFGENSTFKGKLRPYFWVGTTLLKIITFVIELFWAIFRHGNWHLRFSPSKPKFEPRKKWRKLCCQNCYWKFHFVIKFLCLSKGCVWISDYM